MTFEYECPECWEDIQVTSGLKEINCPHCDSLLKVDWDAELIDGNWKDRTTVTLVSCASAGPSAKDKQMETKRGEAREKQP